MKVLLYGLNFAPEPTGIGRYSGEMAEWLAAAGHDVHVVTAPPYYPQWRVAEGFSAWRWTREVWKGTVVHRAPLWVPARPSGIKRLLHLCSFAVLSIPDLIRQAFWRPDVIVVVAPAFACAPAGWLVARLCRAKCWLHVQDFEIDAAFRMGLLCGQFFQRVAHAFESWMLQRFDGVSTISQRMLELASAKRVADDRIVLFPNWVDVHAIAPLRGASAYRQSLDIAADAVVALYSGSLAGKQGLELLPALARLLRESAPNLVIVICGDGVYKESLERDCAGLTNVRILPLQPASRLNELLSMADIHLLPQQNAVADLVMPSKLAGMMASGRPVLATARPNTEVSNVVQGRGRVVEPGNLDAAAAALKELVDDQALRERLGAAARLYAEEHLARDRILAHFEQALKQCISQGSQSRELPVVTAAVKKADGSAESV